MTNELTVVNDQSFITPVASVQAALQRYQGMKDFVSGILRENVDFGMIPGTSKNTLLKPGAEKLASFFGLSTSFELTAFEEDWTGKDHNDEPFFYYRYKCSLRRNGMVIADGEGSCNSWEKKYRWRNAARVCPNCGADAIIKGKQEYGGGWLCFGKKGGCGAKFSDGDQSIEGQNTGQVANPDVADLVNTLQKMAQKRALMAPVLIATNASEYFTQDMDDFIDANFSVDDEPVTTKPMQKRPTQKPVKQEEQESPAYTRPYEPETLKAGIMAKAEKYAGETADQSTRGVVVANLEKCFAGGDAESKRHEFLSWLTGKPSIKDADGAVVLAIRDWLKATQDSGGDWQPNAMAVKEANKALIAAEKENGQDQLI